MGDVKEKCPGGMLGDDIKRFGWGVRHLQALLMFVAMTSLIVVRSSMAVAVLAMTDRTRLNDTNVDIYLWDKKTQGLILSSFFWGYVLMQVPAGMLARRFGGKPILLVALLTNALLCAALPWLTALGGWMVVCGIRLCVGLTQACLFPATHTLLGRWLPEHERTALSGLIYGGMQLGIIIGLPVSGVLADTSFGWPLIFYCMCALMIVTAAAWALLTASTPAEHRFMSIAEREYIERALNVVTKKRVPPTPWKAILSSRPMYGILVAHTGCAIVFVLFFNELPTYLEKGLSIPLRDSALYSALPYVGMWVSGTLVCFAAEGLFNRGLLTALGCRRVFNTLGSVGVAAGLLSLAFFGPRSQSIAIASLIFAVSSSGSFAAGFMLNHLDLSPLFAGLLLSLTNFVANIFSIFIPIFTSFMLNNDPTDLNGWCKVFVTMVVLAVGSNAAYVFLASSERQPWDDPNFADQHAAEAEEMVPVMTEKEKEANKYEIVTSAVEGRS